MDNSLKTAILKHAIIHYVGNKNNGELLHASDAPLQLHTTLSETLSDAFLSKFSTAYDHYSFTHPSSLQFNEVHSFAVQLFAASDHFTSASVGIAQHLFETAVHPKIKGGELYVCGFEGLPFESRICKAVGLFKTEHKSIFLDVALEGGSFNLGLKEGVELTRIDKGCLIINTGKEGFDVLIFDNQNRGEDAVFWKEKFLGLQPQKDAFNQTNHLLTLTKQFITTGLSEEQGGDKTEQFSLLGKSIDYFKSNETFDIGEFQTAVFGDEDKIEGFRDFGSRYTEKHDFDINSNFDISAQAVKKQSRIFKSILKLDRNFHIYIHGNTDMIERGRDSDGRKFYKLYYETEA